MIVILCDGSSRGNPGPASIGIIIWERFKGCNQRIKRPTHIIKASIGTKTNMQAEWQAVTRAIQYIVDKDLCLHDIYLYLDSLTVVNQANGKWKVKHENTKEYHREFVDLKDQCTNLTISWVPRQLMYLADKAAQEGTREQII